MSHQDNQNKENIIKLREHLKELPGFAREFFRGKTDYTSTLTRLAYAYDLKLFFNFLVFETLDFDAKAVESFSISDMQKVNAGHIEEFLEYLSYYIQYKKKDDGTQTELHKQNSAQGKSRKLSAIKSLLSFLYKKGYINSNPAELIQTPVSKEKSKIYLDVHEIANLLDEAENGKNLSQHQKKYHAITQSRDLALLSLFAGTGIRISEAIGINISDIDLQEQCFKVTRKGGDEAILYFGDEVKTSLEQYMLLRKKNKAVQGNEDALFLSLQNKRITARTVQNLVKKYAALAAPLKHITPHKLRTSFGTNMYRQTGDIYLVADLLGHKDVNTTRKSYADTKSEAGRRAVRNYKLRED